MQSNIVETCQQHSWQDEFRSLSLMIDGDNNEEDAKTFTEKIRCAVSDLPCACSFKTLKKNGLTSCDEKQMLDDIYSEVLMSIHETAFYLENRRGNSERKSEAFHFICEQQNVSLVKNHDQVIASISR